MAAYGGQEAWLSGAWGTHLGPSTGQCDADHDKLDGICPKWAGCGGPIKKGGRVSPASSGMLMVCIGRAVFTYIPSTLMQIKNTRACCALALSMLLPLGAENVSAQTDTPRTSAPMEESSTLIPHSQTGWMRAQVQQVDVKNGRLWLRTPDGLLELQAGDTIRRLDQVREGDWLDAQYELGLAVSLAPSSGVRERETTEAAARAPDGRPSGSGFIEEILRVEVLEVEADKAQMRVRGAQGRVGWVRVLDDQVLAQARPGAHLVIRYRLAALLAFRAPK